MLVTPSGIDTEVNLSQYRNAFSPMVNTSQFPSLEGIAISPATELEIEGVANFVLPTLAIPFNTVNVHVIPSTVWLYGPPSAFAAITTMPYQISPIPDQPSISAGSVTSAFCGGVVKILLPMTGASPKNRTDASDGHRSNAFLPMLVTVDGIDKEERPLQLENAYSSIFVTPDGITISSSNTQLLNAEEPMRLRLAGYSTLFSDLHATKNASAISVMPLGSDMLSRRPLL
jgi:hypothetical protein